jgi:hypothetical protein
LRGNRLPCIAFFYGVTDILPLSLSAQTLFAQVVDAARAVGLSRSVADLSGHFAARTIKGRKYWYFRFRDLGGVERMAYAGPDSEALRALIERAKQPSAAPALRQLAQAAISLGNSGVPLAQFKVIARLAEFGFFRAGGVLIGTHAFLSYGNMFGVRWGTADRTQDVDFAHAGKSLSIALPANLQIDTRGAIASLEQGFIPMTQLSGKAGASYRHPTDAAFQLDFLTPRHRGGNEPFEYPALGVVLQPLKFLEYLLEDVIETAIIGQTGAVMVNIPAPERYAVHKLIVSEERIGKSTNPKREKDLHQAAELMSYFQPIRPEAIEEAWRAAINRGPGWRKRAQAALQALDRLHGKLHVIQWLNASGSRKKGFKEAAKSKSAARSTPRRKSTR